MALGCNLHIAVPVFERAIGGNTAVIASRLIVYLDVLKIATRLQEPANLRSRGRQMRFQNASERAYRMIFW